MITIKTKNERIDRVYQDDSTTKEQITHVSFDVEKNGEKIGEGTIDGQALHVYMTNGLDIEKVKDGLSQLLTTNGIMEL